MTNRHTAIVTLAAVLLAACSSDDEPTNEGVGGASGMAGRASSGGTRASSGAGRSSGGNSSSAQTGLAGSTTMTVGGTSVAAGGNSGGTSSVGGTATAAGASATNGGVVASGGVAGSTTMSGTPSDGGTAGAMAAGGTSTMGGTVGTDTTGTDVTGGTSSGGATSMAGSAAASGGVAGASSELGVAGSTSVASAGTAGIGGGSVAKSNCGAVRESVVGWWSLDASLASRADDGPTLEYGPDLVLPSYVPGVASGEALDFSSSNYLQVTDSRMNATDALTLSAFFKASAPEGRIIDHIAAGGVDGYLLDFFGARLRMIIGSRTLVSTSFPTSPDAFTHVAGVFTGGTNPEIRLYVDGALVDQSSVAAGEIPTNSHPLRIGADQNGNNVFSGQIDEPMVFSRALTSDEVKSLRDQLVQGKCPVPVANSPAAGRLLEHDESGVPQSGNLEFVHSNIRRVGDLRVLDGSMLYTCDWNVSISPSVSSCQVWAPFATETTSDYLAPKLPLEWRLLRFNTTGLVDQIGVGIETGATTMHEQTSAALTWLGRDWRLRRYVTNGSGYPLFGSLAALAEQLRAGAGVGVFVNNSNLSLPHATAVVPLTGDNFAVQDPWHISAAPTGTPTQYIFQNSPYHYAVWFDTTGYDYASRWYLGSPASTSDSYGNEPLTFATEPGWTEALAHDATGTVSAGSVAALKAALQGGAALRVGTPEGYFDCNGVFISDFVGCVRYDSYNSADTGDGHLRFDGTHTRMLRYYTTEGRALHENWSDHTNSLASSSDLPEALHWYVQPNGWQLALETNASGDVVLGSVSDLVAAIQSGAEISVMTAQGTIAERVSCASLWTASGPSRAACLSLVQQPRGLASAAADFGYYEARVYNTNGVVASALVPFGSTTNTTLSTPTVALAWYVRAL